MTGQVVGLPARLQVQYLLPAGSSVSIEHVLDTGFEGALTLPPDAVAALSWPFEQQIRASLADGTERTVNLYAAEIEWHGRPVHVALMGLEGKPLLGTALLDQNDLHIHFAEGGEVRIDPF